MKTDVWWLCVLACVFVDYVWLNVCWQCWNEADSKATALICVFASPRRGRKWLLLGFQPALLSRVHTPRQPVKAALMVGITRLCAGAQSVRNRRPRWVAGVLLAHLWAVGCCQITASQTNVWVSECSNSTQKSLKKKKKFKANLERVGENMLFVNYYYYFTFWKLSEISICTNPARVPCSDYCTFLRAGVLGLSCCQRQKQCLPWVSLAGGS